MLQNEWKKKRISKLIDVLYFLAPRLQHCYWHRSPLQPERISAHIFCVIFDTIQRTKVGSATDGRPLPNDDRYRMSKRTFLSGFLFQKLHTKMMSSSSGQKSLFSFSSPSVFGYQFFRIRYTLCISSNRGDNDQEILLLLVSSILEYKNFKSSIEVFSRLCSDFSSVWRKKGKRKEKRKKKDRCISYLNENTQFSYDDVR